MATCGVPLQGRKHSIYSIFSTLTLDTFQIFYPCLQNNLGHPCQAVLIPSASVYSLPIRVHILQTKPGAFMSHSRIGPTERTKRVPSLVGGD